MLEEIANSPFNVCEIDTPLQEMSFVTSELEIYLRNKSTEVEACTNIDM